VVVMEGLGLIFVGFGEVTRPCLEQFGTNCLRMGRRLEEGFVVSEFTTQIMPPQSLRDAIDAKNQAVQNALKAENKVKEAEAEAKIAIAKAEGEAKALRIQGDGEAYYNRVVAASLNELLVRQDAIEKWDGKLPEYTGGSIPFINASVNK
ncbi:MAG: hypothetical protein MJY92_08300, partial [Bacteroidales bacterium]|nr:hypothetical protein [Bacteroidales bacterium]